MWHCSCNNKLEDSQTCTKCGEALEEIDVSPQQEINEILDQIDYLVQKVRKLIK